MGLQKGFILKWQLNDDKGEAIAWENRNNEITVINKELSIIKLDEALLECKKRFTQDLIEIERVKNKVREYNG